MSVVTKKPGRITHTITRYDGSFYEIEVVRVHEDFYSPQFAEACDPLKCNRDVLLFDEHLFDGLNNKDQAAIASKLSVFFDKYSKWIKTRDQGEQ